MLPQDGLQPTGRSGVAVTAPSAGISHGYNAAVLAFGPFRLELRTYVLARDGAMAPLSPKLVQVLACLAEAQGALVTRELLLDRFWPGVTVTDNTLTRAIADIRKVLGDDPGHPTYIQTEARRGYRFVAPVRAEPPQGGAPGADAPGALAGVAGLEPFVAWERGRAVLESLTVSALPSAADAFRRAVAGAPHYAPAHAGLANAHIFRFEATRVDNAPDVPALAAAVGAARRATELDPLLGEGWAALGHALAGAGRVEESRAAVRQALALEPRNWRHHYRMAVASWGEERLRAVEHAEALLPGFPGAQTMSAMVLIARQAFLLAAEAAARGAAAQATQHGGTLYPGNGLLWMRGLTAVARGQLTAALADFSAEAAFATTAATVYARESLVLAHEAYGFTAVALGQSDLARAAFAAAEAASPGHGRARLGRALAEGDAARAVERVTSACAELEQAAKHGERTLLLAAALGWRGEVAAGVARAEQALDGAWPDATGWSLPANPMFAPLRAGGTAVPLLGAACFARLVTAAPRALTSRFLTRTDRTSRRRSRRVATWRSTCPVISPSPSRSRSSLPRRRPRSRHSRCCREPPSRLRPARPPPSRSQPTRSGCFTTCSTSTTSGAPPVR